MTHAATAAMANQVRLGAVVADELGCICPSHLLTPLSALGGGHGEIFGRWRSWGRVGATVQADPYPCEEGGPFCLGPARPTSLEIVERRIHRKFLFLMDDVTDGQRSPQKKPTLVNLPATDSIPGL